MKKWERGCTGEELKQGEPWNRSSTNETYPDALLEHELASGRWAVSRRRSHVERWY